MELVMLAKCTWLSVVETALMAGVSEEEVKRVGKQFIEGEGEDLQRGYQTATYELQREIRKALKK